jgi:hypothetical protein
MNTLFALIILTSTGAQEAHVFPTKAECEAVSTKLKTESFCVAKTPVDMNKEMDKMFSIMKQMKNRMEKDFESK